jgi:acyl-CoA reductase-like NAD-dependent aldehyde dehydrogenase
MILAKLAAEAGVPAGCLNIIHGAHVCIQASSVATDLL